MRQRLCAPDQATCHRPNRRPPAAAPIHLRRDPQCRPAFPAAPPRPDRQPRRSSLPAAGTTPCQSARGSGAGKRSTCSSGARRRMRMITLRVMIKSGNQPSPASATAAKLCTSSVSTRLPYTTQRPKVAPRRWPLLRTTGRPRALSPSARKWHRSRRTGLSAARRRCRISDTDRPVKHSWREPALAPTAQSPPTRGFYLIPVRRQK